MITRDTGSLVAELRRVCLDRHIPRGVEMLGGYVDAVVEMGHVLGLTSDSSTESVVNRLVLPALRPWRMVRLRPTGRLLDLGAGNGAFAVASAVLHPYARITALDRSERVGAFLSEVARRLDLSNVEVVCAQIEKKAPELSGKFDIVGCRALAAGDDAVRLSAPFVAPGGWLFIWRSRDQRVPAATAGALDLEECGRQDLSDVALPLELFRFRRPVCPGDDG